MYDVSKEKEQLKNGEIMDEKEASKEFNKNAGKVENEHSDLKYYSSVLDVLAPYLYIINKLHNL